MSEEERNPHAGRPFDDDDATIAKATELGARVFMPPMSMPGVGRFAMFGDPGGAALAVIALDLEHLK